MTNTGLIYTLHGDTYARILLKEVKVGDSIAINCVYFNDKLRHADLYKVVYNDYMSAEWIELFLDNGRTYTGLGDSSILVLY